MKKRRTGIRKKGDAPRYTQYFEEIAFWYRGGRWPQGRDVALVFGKVLGFYNLQGMDCHASTQRIADELSMSRPTVVRCLRILEDDGLIKDMGPELRGAPHWYTLGEWKGQRTHDVLRNAVAEMHERAPVPRCKELPDVRLNHIGQSTGGKKWEIYA